MAHRRDLEKAVALVTLALQPSPATHWRARDRAGRLLDELQAQLSPAAFAAAQERADALDLQAIVAELTIDLESAPQQPQSHDLPSDHPG